MVVTTFRHVRNKHVFQILPQTAYFSNFCVLAFLYRSAIDILIHRRQFTWFISVLHGTLRTFQLTQDRQAEEGKILNANFLVTWYARHSLILIDYFLSHARQPHGFKIQVDLRRECCSASWDEKTFRSDLSIELLTQLPGTQRPKYSWNYHSPQNYVLC